MDVSIASWEINKNGYTIIDSVYTPNEIDRIIDLIENVNPDKPTFRQTADLFAIRQFLQEVPDVYPFIFNEKLNSIITSVYGSGYFPVKSIYFDKPVSSNWFVAYHQDLTISVKNKVDLPGYGPWTVKHNQFAVQPPLNVLQSNFTIRIHLDDACKDNGALKVIPGSHLKGIYRPESIDWAIEKEDICEVEAGGIMLMSPLLLHASNRTVNNKKRRVIHIEFSNVALTYGLDWSEKN